MEFTCSRQRLADVLAPINEIVPSRTPKPVLQNLSIRADGENRLILSATDLEIGIQYRLEVKDLVDPEPVLIPAHRLNALVQGDRSEEWKVQVSGGKMKITAARGELTVNGNVSDEFPAIPSIDPADGKVVQMNGDDLAVAVSKTAFCVAKGDARYALNGIFVKCEGTSAEFVSSDTHRLSRITRKIRNAEDVAAEGIVIARGMNTLAKLSVGHETVTLKFTGKELIAQTFDATLVIRLVDGQFPRYRDVIPAKCDNKVTVDREELGQLLRLAGYLANEETRVVRLAAGDGKVLIRADGGDSGDARLELAAETEGEPVELSFNHVFMLDMLKALSDEKITMMMKDADTPLRVDSGDFTHIVMPLRRY